MGEIDAAVDSRHLRIQIAASLESSTTLDKLKKFFTDTLWGIGMLLFMPYAALRDSKDPVVFATAWFIVGFVSCRVLQLILAVLRKFDVI